MLSPATRNEMAAVAAATGSNCIVGVRPKGTWFAHCDGDEFDGSTPLQAVRSVARALRQRAERDVVDANRALAAATATVEALRIDR